MRLIDADKLESELTAKLRERDSWSIGYLLCLIDEACEINPAPDCVPVVRCKDCVYEKCGICYYWRHFVRHDGFCSYGEEG